jgi:outer membrane protein OmpA-like peptidoglycan-associated protein
MKSFIYATLLVLLSFDLFAQEPPEFSTKNHKALDLYMKSDEFLMRKQFPEAIQVLQEAIEKDPNFVEAYNRIGTCYIRMHEDKSAKKYFEKVIELNPNSSTYAGVYQQLGDIYMKDAEYAEAKKFYLGFLDFQPRPDFVRKVNRLIATCDFAVEAMKHPLDFKPAPMAAPINTFSKQYFPVLTGDKSTMYYTVRGDGAADENIYVSNLKNNLWEIPKSISTMINTPENEGGPSVSADGKVIVFTSCNKKDGFGSCDLYVTNKVGDDWTKPVNMGNVINTNGWESQPSLTGDGKTIFFASGRKTGVGKYDLYTSSMGDDGVWSVPENLGKKINTNEIEVSPFIDPSGKVLYFASDGHIGMGGTDIFVSIKSDTGWTTAKNVGFPLNTNNDEEALFITADQTRGYFSTDKYDDNGAMTSMIYEFEFPKELKTMYISKFAKGTVYDAVTNAKLQAHVELFDLKTGKRVVSTESDIKNGDYTAVLTQGSEYALYANKKGYLFKSMFFDYKTPESFSSQALDIFLEPIKLGATITLTNVFYASGKFNLEDKSKVELEKILALFKENPSMKVEISGHTDDVGKDLDNIALSKNRAKAVYDFLISAGIPAENLKYQGYGKSKPVVPNTTPENKAKNRRIEFKVI